MAASKPGKVDRQAITQDFARLEANLREQLAISGRILEGLARKKLALREMDVETIQSICESEQVDALSITELERGRLETVRGIAAAIQPGATQLPSLNELAAWLDEEDRARLLAVGSQLRAAIEDIRRQSSVIRLAAETLGRHMSGIVQSVHAALSRARVYGRRGRIAVGTQVQFAVDLKS